ncbi:MULTISPECIES: cation diffusion facilitator family transporter [Sphingobium]|uniref:cation diffusion facilitator family transporter n=1 Tax=Sphingobium TaxID=165695 RepID=UPI0015EBC023|nr:MULTISPECIES: cation diffusion facilitator family transporter [Sphingobium]MCW2363700.1 ferrous-iron efflux pump FieF [Sphingobium sp. B10D3B]MCW2364922.1 ferrous-iron efflux pump FieF [Sphingobium sp. B7D2B]MCW2402902.1 ferrous-iron efflux pump FieF [Sphingobium sp. B10D7B]MCW2409880.1 ferrous-iron efflux pump FieF [Sphingobium xanthum]
MSAATPAAREDHLATTGAINRKAALASVAVALILAAAKSWAVLRTESIAMLGSLADTGLDLVASLVTLFAVRLAARPADYDHRFGHGKAEALAALFQVSLISVAAVLIILRSVERFGSAGTPTAIEYGIGVSILAIVLTILLVSYQARAIRATGSVAISADSLHYRSDLLLNGSVILALVLETALHLRGADALFGLGIGLWLALNAGRTAMHAIGELMDKEWPLEKRQRFLDIAERHPALHGIHDLRTRSSGSHDIAQFHIWLDPHMSLKQAHDVMEDITRDLTADFPGLELIIHPDPADQPESDLLTQQDARTVLVNEAAASDKTPGPETPAP